MTRQEENKKIIEYANQKAEEMPEGTCEELASFYLGIISTMIADISKSLAIIADSKVIYRKQDGAESEV